MLNVAHYIRGYFIKMIITLILTHNHIFVNHGVYIFFYKTCVYINKYTMYISNIGPFCGGLLKTKTKIDR